MPKGTGGRTGAVVSKGAKKRLELVRRKQFDSVPKTGRPCAFTITCHDQSSLVPSCPIWVNQT